MVLANGRASIERTLIGIGAALHAIGVAVSLGITLFQRAGFQQGASHQTVLLLYGFSGLITFAGTAVGLYGAVRLLNRTSQLELLLEDPATVEAHLQRWLGAREEYLKV